jgi:lipoprotein NlpI
MKWVTFWICAFTLTIAPCGHADVGLGAARDYARRGDDQFRFGHYQAAIENYTQAIKIEPNAPRYYYARATTEGMLGLDDAELADLDTVARLNPHFAGIYNARAAIKQKRGDLDGAISDFTLAIDLAPRNFKHYCNRGLVRYEKGDLTEAADDFRQASQLEPVDPYPEIFLWLAHTREGQAANANEQLSAFLEKHVEKSPDHWGSKVCSFLIGKINETEFLGGTRSYFAFHQQGHECEAWYYAGLKRLLAGDKNGAVDAFRKSIETNARRFQEYNLAEFELKRLGKG